MLQNAAFDYRERGLSTVPLVKGTKKAAIAWKPYQDRLPTVDELLSWNFGGVGIITGSVSNVVVIDSDRDEAEAELRRRGIPDGTPTVRTGRGRQFYFRHPGGHVKTGPYNGIPGVDVKGDSGYVVAPPSVHPSGKVYRWETPINGPLPELPGWFFDGPAEEAAAPVSVIEGGRNVALTHEAGKMRRAGFDGDVIDGALQVFNLKHCNPPLPAAEVSQIARSVGRYDTPASGFAPNLYSAADLMHMHLPEPRWAVPGLIPEGMTVLAGKPKIGKSWLALQLAVAVAGGSSALDYADAEQGDVLYLGLEDNPRRMQDRLKTLLLGGPAPARLTIAHEWPKLDDGGLDAIEGWLTDHRDARLVVIDVLARIKGGGKGRNRNAYEIDYDAIAPVQALGKRYGVAILVLHHLRKGDADDPMDLVSGSLGQVGPADGVLILRRPRTKPDGSLFVMGRDIKDESDLAVQFTSSVASWRVVGKAEDIQISNERKAIIEVLRDIGEPATPKQVAEMLDDRRTYGTVQRTLLRMANDGQIGRDQRGAYSYYWVKRSDESYVSDESYLSYLSASDSRQHPDKGSLMSTG